MSLEYYAILTEIGAASIANAAVYGEQVTLTQFAVGDDGGSYYKPTKEMTSLKGEQWRGEINSYEVDASNANLISVKAVVPATIGGFTIREMGLFDDKGQMIAVSNTPDSVKITTDSGAVKEMDVIMELLISNTSAVTIQVNPTVAIATKEDIQKHNESNRAHREEFNKKANVLHEHSADDITSGVFSIEKGGTGKTTAGEALKALGGFSERGGTITGDVTINENVIMKKTVQEGYNTTASGSASHAEGVDSIANGSFSHAEGWETTTSDEATSAHAEGYKTTVSGSYAHAEGKETIASGRYSHAEGWGTEASGNYAHAQGAFTEARATHSFTAGNETLAAAENQFVIGTANKESTDKNDIFIIGNGITRNSASAMSNCLRVTKSSGVYSNSTYHSTGADYAEYFQWKDRNSNYEDRVGLFVTLDGEEISIAKPNDDILGIVSACPSVCGESHQDQWKDMYITDIYGRPILEEITIPDEFIMLPDPQNPEKTIKTLIQEAHTEIRQKLNENYDSTQRYIPRSKRPEWSAVGLLGKLVVIDDGVCKVNDWCTAGEGGIAVKSEQKTRFKVMARLDQNHIRVMML